MFNRVIAKQTPPKYLSSDHDPLIRFQRWRANLLILEVTEVKAGSCAPRSHTFVERLIGTIRREYLDRTLFWNGGDLERKPAHYQAYYNHHRCHTGLAGATPDDRSGFPHRQPHNWNRIPGDLIAMACFRLPPPLKL
jgi:putative transposase